jgi:transcriptional regulator with XRE-family HTH domain
MKKDRSVLPPPDQGLPVLGMAVRAARVARGLTQQRLASQSNVSRAQLAGLEQGENVSVAFLLKVAHRLELSSISLDGRVELSSGGAGVNVVQLLATLDVLGNVVERLRSIVLNTAAPAVERVELTDAPAMAAFVARHASNPEGLARLEEAIRRLGDEKPLDAPPTIAEDERPRSARAPDRKRNA